jgi:hypothetical protein
MAHGDGEAQSHRCAAAQQLLERKHQELGYELEAQEGYRTWRPAIDDEVGDDLLRLVFISCHPVLSREPGRAYTAAHRRADHRRNRAGLPDLRAYGCTAHCTRQAEALGGACAV